MLCGYFLDSREESLRRLRQHGWNEKEAQWILQQGRQEKYRYNGGPGGRFPFTDVRPGERLRYGGYTLEVVDLAGHTPHQIGLADRQHRWLFLGDTLSKRQVLILSARGGGGKPAFQASAHAGAAGDGVRRFLDDPYALRPFLRPEESGREYPPVLCAYSGKMCHRFGGRICGKDAGAGIADGIPLYGTQRVGGGNAQAAFPSFQHAGLPGRAGLPGPCRPAGNGRRLVLGSRTAGVFFLSQSF